MQMFRATAKLDPAAMALMGNSFWQKWQETVTDMADTARQSAGAKSMSDVLTAQIGFGVRNTERWTQWAQPAADVAAAMEPEEEAEPAADAASETSFITASEVAAEPVKPAPSEAAPAAAQAAPASVQAEPAPAEAAPASAQAEPASAAPSAALASAPAPVASAEPAAAPAPVQKPDDLTRIRGIGPAIERKLHDRGVTTFQQIAELSDAEMTALDDALDFRGRIERDDWVAQAQKLALR